LLLEIGRFSTLDLARQTKLTIYKTLIRPVLLYGSELWLLTKRKLLVFEGKVLRTIYGPKIKDGMYRIRYNFELDRDFNSPNVIGVVKRYGLRCVGYMIRGAEDLPQRALFVQPFFF
jgi:hypothetical protein